MHLLLSVSTIKPGKFHDPACTFEGGEHEFIGGPSYVVYGKPEQRHAKFIAKMVAAREYLPKANLDQAHFRRICDGLFKSNFTKPFVIDYFSENPP